jgi:glycosyltransferase involved in cell wall biosynthesis
LFYSDSPGYGGHEAMTVEAVRYLCRDSKLTVSFAFYSGNNRLQEKLQAIQIASGNLSLLPFNFRAERLQAFRSLVSWRKIEHIQTLMKQIDPDVVVVSQGRIEGGSMGLLAAKRGGYHTISYLPVAHPVSVSGRHFVLWIREAVNRYFYRLPDKIITISESSRRMLLERDATPNVVVVPNAVETPPIKQMDRQRFRETHRIVQGDYVVATIGRIQFKDKGQDFAVKAIARFRNDFQDCKFVFVGEGPDEGKLRAMIESLDLSRQVKILPWTPNPTEVYAGADMLLIPSRFEGVPLVMLEAMAYGLPIVATNVDGMAEFLPPDWLFPPGDCGALRETFLRVRSSDNSLILERHQNRIANEFTAQRFCMQFRAAVYEQAEPLRSSKES